MIKNIGGKVGFVLANVGVMVVLHGNSKQFWPKIPYLSLRDESVPEHMRLLFNTLAIVTAGQAALGKLPRERWIPRGAVLAALPLALPALIWFGQKVLRLKGQSFEAFNLTLVPLLPIGAMALEEVLVAKLTPPMEEDHADYSHLV